MVDSDHSPSICDSLSCLCYSLCPEINHSNLPCARLLPPPLWGEGLKSPASERGKAKGTRESDGMEG